MRKLATLQKITNLRKHPNADTLDLINIKGWELITKTGDFKEGIVLRDMYNDRISVKAINPDFLLKYGL